MSQRIYAGTLEFFFDVYGGSVIGAVWDPSVLSPRPFRVLAEYSSAPVVVPDDHDHGPEIDVSHEILLFCLCHFCLSYPHLIAVYDLNDCFDTL